MGSLKSLPSDFVVTETLRSLRSLLERGGPFALVRLRKTDVNTATATAELARAIGVGAARVVPAGLKDRRAFTTQFVTVDMRPSGSSSGSSRGGERDDGRELEALAGNDDNGDEELESGGGASRGGVAAGGGRMTVPQHAPAVTAQAQRALGQTTTWGSTQWRAQLVGWTDRHISSKDLRGNRFEITLRRLTADENTELERRVRALTAPVHSPLNLAPGAVDDDDDEPALAPSSSPSSSSSSSGPALPVLRFVNYFGPQRFGSLRHGLGFVTPALIRGDFEEAVRREIAVATAYDSRAERASRQHIAEHWGRWDACLSGLPAGSPYRAAVAALAHSNGNFKEAFLALPPVPRDMTVLAYQAHLWNELAVRFVQELCQLRPARGPGGVGGAGSGSALWSSIPMTRLDICTPTMSALAPLTRRPEAVPLLQPRSMLPLLGPATLLTSSEFPQPQPSLPDTVRLVQTVLAGQKLALTLSELRIPGLRRPHFAAGARPWLAYARRFSMADAELDDRAPQRKQEHPDHPPLLKRRLSFELDPGSYATVLVRFLVPTLDLRPRQQR